MGKRTECEAIENVRSLIGKEIETLEQKVAYRISRITNKNVKVNKMGTSTPIYIPREIFCNAENDLSNRWISIRPLKEKWGTGYDGILKGYTPTMVSHVVAPILVEIGLCEVKKDEGHWKIRLKKEKI